MSRDALRARNRDGTRAAMGARMQKASLLSITILALACVPSIARADALTSTPAPEPDVPAPASPSLELSVGVRPVLGLGGLGGLAGNGLGLGLMPTVDVGVMLDPRVALVVGGQLWARDAESGAGLSSGFSVWVPLLLQIYLDEPRVGAIVPTMRIGVLGHFYGVESVEGYGGGARLSGGITWLADRWIALRLEVGGEVDVSYAEADSSIWIHGALDARGSVVMRL
jgi:hypothetical protein